MSSTVKLGIVPRLSDEVDLTGYDVGPVGRAGRKPGAMAMACAAVRNAVTQSERDTARASLNAERRKTYLGMVWICEPGELPYKVSIESGRPRGLLVEMQTFLERFIGRNLEVALYETKRLPNSVEACAIVRQLVHCETIYRAGLSTTDCNPFGTIFRGAVTINYSPHWYKKPERQDSMRGIDLEDYACPSYE